MAIRGQTQSRRGYAYPVLNMGNHLARMKDILAGFEKNDTINRIWHRDYTVWKPEPAEISNRLGWLQSTDFMIDRIPELESFAAGVREAGYHTVVLLGMGGSSLGPEVLRQTFGSAPHFPPLIVLDSTVPARIEEIIGSIEPRHTLFLVSSKSGTTTETLALYRCFRDLVARDVGEGQAGFNFTAVTDAGTPLAAMAEETGFRRVFINPSDIGGRYSVFSYFGLVPAALLGLDLRLLIDKAVHMQEDCAPCVDIYENPAVWMGTLIGHLALSGHDKLTLIISPSVRSLGLWIEQLIAESTGKEGKGIIPVIDEPLLDTSSYGNDRVFVYLRMKGDNNRATDEAVERIEIARLPVIQLEISDHYDIGAEFFRWEIATAVAGAVLGINPFDQPDVQDTKTATKRLLGEFRESGKLPALESGEGLRKLLRPGPARGSYLAILAYFKQTPAADRALADLRRRISEKYKLATTLGYGPRYLHSTGQLHKGGPDKGLYLQLTARGRRDIPVPGEPYTLGILTEAEAQGDYLALKSKGRKVVRLQLTSAGGPAIRKIGEEV